MSETRQMAILMALTLVAGLVAPALALPRDREGWEGVITRRH